ncbi:histidinol-phosphate transaminase [Leucobacter chromiiresistens]|uniref:Histidinol-phosphate aminotransferase n=1 Tax=Leucobacter chromiiresistens TaxID=1079994 RepID=A0A1H1AH04_9MICO|nr:histidinol-phosphate transaminase [Leucobacter chromiiresistens]SDQ38938.1 histidinol-phosphate aminotransferase [Leucobacter chromiiresistens]
MTSLSDLPLRDNLVGQQPYGAPQDAVRVSLNVNENTHPIPENVAIDIVQSLARAVTGVNRYPDREFTELRGALAGYLGYGLVAEQVWAANGSNEVLQQVLQAFAGPGRSLLSFTPTYSMYPLLAAGTDTAWIGVERPADYALTPEAVVAALREHRPDVAILCGPNNPTGTTLDREVIVAAYDAFDGMLVIDEAYQEFDTERESAVALLPGRHRLIVSRTMSKAFAFAGVRLGYLAADPAVIDALRLVRLPYHLSALTQAAATAAIRHADAMLATVADISAQRDRLAGALTELGYTVHPSGANFLLVGGFADPEATFEELRAQGILIRNLSIPGHLRITAGTAAETGAVIDAIAALGPGGARG